MIYEECVNINEYFFLGGVHIILFFRGVGITWCVYTNFVCMNLSHSELKFGEDDIFHDFHVLSDTKSFKRYFFGRSSSSVQIFCYIPNSHTLTQTCSCTLS